MDKLELMMKQQEEFMRLLQKERNFPSFPVDLTSKEGQKAIKLMMYEMADELAEARLHLKNKPHRATVINDVDRKAYVEELCDVFHYLNEILIASGISVDEIFDAYMAKGEKNTARILNGY